MPGNVHPRIIQLSVVLDTLDGRYITNIMEGGTCALCEVRAVIKKIKSKKIKRNLAMNQPFYGFILF